MDPASVHRFSPFKVHKKIAAKSVLNGPPCITQYNFQSWPLKGWSERCNEMQFWIFCTWQRSGRPCRRLFDPAIATELKQATHFMDQWNTRQHIVIHHPELHSMIQQKWDFKWKWTFITQFWNLFQGLPIGQNDRNSGKLKHLKPIGLLQNDKDLICDFLKLKEIQGKRLPDTLLSSPYTLQHPQNTPGHSKTPSSTPNTSRCPPGTALTTSNHILWGIWVVKECQGGLREKWRCQKLSVECQECLWVSMAGLSWMCQKWCGSVWGFLKVSWRCL